MPRVMSPLKDADAFHEALENWFLRARRPLPWREDYEPYHVWISEIMLQQTQMERGVAYYRKWMEKFPDIATLAAASEEAVLRAWEGLGYYSRARAVVRAAAILKERFHCRFPSDPEAIRSLPGVGPYTAAAIASIAFSHDIACVDANVERIVTRLFDIDEPLSGKTARRRVAELAGELLPPGRAQDAQPGHDGARSPCLRKGPPVRRLSRAGILPRRGAGNSPRKAREKSSPGDNPPHHDRGPHPFLWQMPRPAASPERALGRTLGFSGRRSGGRRAPWGSLRRVRQGENRSRHRRHRGSPGHKPHIHQPQGVPAGFSPAAREEN